MFNQALGPTSLGQLNPKLEAKFLSRWGSPENPMKSAYLVAQGYANICKIGPTSLGQLNPKLAAIFLLRWGSPENPVKSAYLVAQGYANICKMVSIVIMHLIAIPTNFWKFAYPSATTPSD